jgi:subtilase family serine protease
VFGSENCTTAKPNLAVGASDIGWVTEKVVGGDRVTVVATIHNTGNAAVSGAKAQLAVDGAAIGTPSIPTLAPGSFARVSAVWDAKGQTGDHTVAVTADLGAAIDEVAEDDNAASKTLAIKGNKVR